MLNQDKPKRGRQFGAYPQRLLRVACGEQELRGIHEAVPDTRLRAVALLAWPTIIEALSAIEQLALELPSIEYGQEIASLAHEALVVLKGESSNGK